MAASGPGSWSPGVADDSASQRGATLVVTVLLGASLISCGGGSGGAADGQRDNDEQGEQQNRSAEIPAADRAAFYGIATASGSLRNTVVSAALGETRRPYDTAELRAVRRRLAALRAKDPRLAGLQVKLTAALNAAIPPPRRQSALRQAARRALAASDEVNAGLQSYAARHPAVAALVPD